MEWQGKEIGKKKGVGDVSGWRGVGRGRGVDKEECCKEKNIEKLGLLHKSA